MFKYLLFTALLYFISYLYYVKVSHGLGHKAEFLQLRRFLPCALLAVAPAATAQIQLTNSLLLTSMAVGISWIITYLYYIGTPITKFHWFRLPFWYCFRIIYYRLAHSTKNYCTKFQHFPNYFFDYTNNSRIFNFAYSNFTVIFIFI